MTILPKKKVLATKLRQMDPQLSQNIERLIDDGGGLVEVQRIMLKVKRQLGDKPAHINTAEAMIEAYTELQLAQRNRVKSAG